MKKRIICLVTALMMISALFFGCADSGDNANAVELPKPTGLYVTKSDNTVHWDAVENASGYKIKINGTEYEVKENYYTIENADYGKSYEIEVVAVGDGKNYRRSRISITKYTVPVLTTEKDSSLGLSYSFINQEKDVAVTKEYDLPIDSIKGKLIISDTFVGHFVVNIYGTSFKARKSQTGANEYSGAYITSVVFPVKLREIGFEAFCGQIMLESVEIPFGVNVGDAAFKDCAKLQDIRLKNEVSLGEETFAGVKATCIVIPNTTKKVGKNVLGSENKTIYYEGTQEKWSEIAEEQSKTYVYFYSEEKPSTEGMFWHYDSNRNPVKW